jgi:peptide methionine sulfoxide reductase msrA/msrB
MRKHIFLLVALLALTAPFIHAQSPTPSSTKTAIFAGGCFWCMQAEFDHEKAVSKTVVGFTGGEKADANYNAVSSHRTKHREAIEVTYDPAKISYDQLLDIFWSNIDPTQADGQFADRGLSYQTAIYVANDEERKIAEASKVKIGKSGKFEKPVATEILPVMPFYAAEDYHQKYYQKNPGDYEAYHVGSGRAAYKKRVWGKAAKE